MQGSDSVYPSPMTPHRTFHLPRDPDGPWSQPQDGEKRDSLYRCKAWLLPGSSTTSAESSATSGALEPEMVASIPLNLRVQTSAPRSRGDRDRSRPIPAAFYSPEWEALITH